MEKQLQVFGPELTEKRTNGIIGENGLFAQEWKARVNHRLRQRVFVNGGGTLPRPAPSVAARDVRPGKAFSGPDCEVTATPAEHVQPWLDTFSYRVVSSEGSVIFTCDTQPCDSVTELARGADMMLCMRWDDQAVVDANGEYSYQRGTSGAARMAWAAGVKKPLLVHVGPHHSARGVTEQGIGDVSRIHDGEIVFSEELMRISL